MTRVVRRRLALGGGVTVFVALVGYNANREWRDRVEVSLAEVTRGNVVATVRAGGEVRAAHQVVVTADVSGRVVEVFVEEGARVAEGQALCRVDAHEAAAASRQSEASLGAARAELVRAQEGLRAGRQALERTRTMYEEQLVSRQALEQAEADAKMKAAEVEALRRRVGQQEAVADSSRRRLARTTIVSPLAGTVTVLKARVGETVAGLDGVAATPIATVADLSSMVLEAMVDEGDIHALEVGQPAVVRLDSVDEPLTGKVAEIGAVALERRGGQGKDFKVEVALEEASSARPGLSATVEVETGRRESVVCIPVQAMAVRHLTASGEVVNPGDLVGQDPERLGLHREDGVFLVTGGKVSWRKVRTGLVGDEYVEVLDGPDVGSTIVGGPFKILRSLDVGARVRGDRPRKSVPELSVTPPPPVDRPEAAVGPATTEPPDVGVVVTWDAGVLRVASSETVDDVSVELFGASGTRHVARVGRVDEGAEVWIPGDGLVPVPPSPDWRPTSAWVTWRSGGATQSRQVPVK